METRVWLKRLLLLVALALIVVISLGLIGLYLARGEPEFYRRLVLTVEQREAAAQSATNKFAAIQNEAARIRATERAGERNGNRATTSAASDASTAPIAVSFTADELNSFFEKWSVFQNWKASYDRYLEDPAIFLQDNRIILAGKVKDLGLLASVHFEPKIDENGMLDVELVRVLGGRLPLPQSIIDGYEQRATQTLQQKMPAWQRAAAIHENGAANPDAIAASAAQFLFHTLKHEPAEPVMFLPVIGQKGSVAVRITDVKIEHETLTLTVRPMSRAEQQSLLEKIRSAK